MLRRSVEAESWCEGWEDVGRLLYRLLLHSRHRILSPSGKKPAPTSETEHWEQVKHGWCHWRSSNEMYFPPPKPGDTKKNGTGINVGRALRGWLIWCRLSCSPNIGLRFYNFAHQLDRSDVNCEILFIHLANSNRKHFQWVVIINQL